MRWWNRRISLWRSWWHGRIRGMRRECGRGKGVRRMRVRRRNMLYGKRRRNIHVEWWRNSNIVGHYHGLSDVARRSGNLYFRLHCI
jgi:hypothetical protein